MYKAIQIKSKERVRDLAEVFTGEREVNAMLDLVKNQSEKIDSTFLEPACGNGNFLIAILKRKLDTVQKKYKKQEEVEFYTIIAVASIYGIDISEENVAEARQRMLNEVKNFYYNIFNTKKVNKSFWDSINWILEKNIILGDTINKMQDIVFIEYSVPKKYFLERKEFRLVEQMSISKELLKKQNIKIIQLFSENIKLKNYKACKCTNLCQ